MCGYYSRAATNRDVASIPINTVSVLLHTTQLQTVSSNSYTANSWQPSNPVPIPLTELNIFHLFFLVSEWPSRRISMYISLLQSWCMAQACTCPVICDFTKEDTTPADPATYVRNLKSAMQELKATPVRSHPQRTVQQCNQQCISYMHSCLCAPQCSS